jgi:hypothetical protein
MKNNRYKPIWATILLGVMVMIVLMGSVSAWDMTINNVKDYDAATKTVTISDSYLVTKTKIADATLITPHNVDVIAGKDRKVAEFSINLSGDSYDAPLKEISIICNGKTDDRKITTKQKIEKFVDEPVYETTCVNDGAKPNNKTTCTTKEIGTAKRDISTWEEIDLAKAGTITKGKITIGLFTDVKPNDYCDQIPNLFGIEIPEWSTWTSSFNNNLTSYWDFNSTTDIISAINLANKDGGIVVYNTTDCKIGKCGHFIQNANLKIAGNTNVNFTGNFTYNLWVNAYGSYADGVSAFFGRGALYDATLDREGTNDLYAEAVWFGAAYTGSGILPLSEWHMITLVRNGDTDNVTLYFDAAVKKSAIGGTVEANPAYESAIGTRGASDYDLKGNMDEMSYWTRQLSPSEVTDLYNGGAGLTYVAPTVGTPSSVTTTLVTPINNSNFSSSVTNMTFNATVSVAGTNMTNMTLFIWNSSSYIWNQTLNKVTGNATNFTTWNISINLLPDNIYNWNVYSCANNDTGNNCAFNSNFTFTKDATSPSLSIVYPITKNYTTNVSELNYTVYDLRLNACWYSVNATNTTITCGTNATSLTSVEGNNTWYAWANDTFGNVRSTSVGFNKDTLIPNVSITYPLNTSYVINVSTLNYTLADINLQSCWYSINNGLTNVSITCGQNATGLTSILGSNTWTVYANDSYGNVNTTKMTFSKFLFIENSKTFTALATEMSSETLSINITWDNETYPNIYSYIYYNNTAYISAKNGQIFSNTVSLPSVSSITNMSFFWEFILDSSTNGNSTKSNQTVSKYTIDDCSGTNVTLLNYTMKDETNQNKFAADDNATIQITVTLSSLDQATSRSFSLNSTSNPVAVCVNGSIGKLRLDAITLYSASNHATEYHNLQNVTINSTSYLQQINLLDLDTASATNCITTFKDSNFLIVPNAIIDLTRQYISEGAFKSVEVPKTDTNGQVVLHVIRNDARYTIIAKKEGVILGTWNNMIALNDPSTGVCTINLNLMSSTTSATDWTTAGGITYSIATDYPNKNIVMTFTSVDSSPKTVILNATKFDALGNTTICTDSLTSTSGTLTCHVTSTFGNATVKTNLYSNNVYLGSKIDTFGQDARDIFGYTGIVLLIVMFGMLPFFFISSPVGMVVSAMVAVISAAILNIYSGGGIIGIGSTAIWFIIAGGIIIWKMTREGTG